MKIVPTLSVILSLLVILISYSGLFIPGFYFRDTLNIQAQSIGQDLVDLFLIVPCLIATGFLATKNSIAKVLWGGTMLYLIYTFIIYCFDLHFNNLFVIYCAVLGLSFYSFIYFLSEYNKEVVIIEFKKLLPIKVAGIYFLVISAIFYFLWLSEIIPAILQSTTPKSLIETGLFTNPVQVLDLSVFLPGFFITGVLVLKRKPVGLLLAPVMLTFFVLMDITIGVLVFVMKQKGLESDLSVTFMMMMFALFSLMMLIWYLRNRKQPL